MSEGGKVSGWKLSSTEKHIAFLMLTNSTKHNEEVHRDFRRDADASGREW